jgi:peptide deformylase
MRDVMEGANGIGLAATQVGIVESVLVYRVERDSPIVAVINPEIQWRGGETEIAEEGCLSLPGIHVDVERDIHVRVAAVDETGSPYTIEASGLEARVLQHEIDHLDGVLMLDRTTREQRRDAMRTWRELQQTE